MIKICNSCKKPTDQFFTDNIGTVNCIVCYRKNNTKKVCPNCGRSIHNTSKTCIPCTQKNNELKVA